MVVAQRRKEEDLIREWHVWVSKVSVGKVLLNWVVGTQMIICYCYINYIHFIKEFISPF